MNVITDLSQLGKTTVKLSGNPNYVAYARAHGKTSDEMLARDKEMYPGGCMVGFILWISVQHRNFYQAHPECCLGPHVIGDLEAWKAFLQEAAGKAASDLPQRVPTECVGVKDVQDAKVSEDEMTALCETYT